MSFGFIGSTMNGSFSTFNFEISGIFNLNLGPIDKDMMIVDIKGAEFVLDMENAASEILGYEKGLYFDDNETVLMRNDFNIQFATKTMYKLYLSQKKYIEAESILLLMKNNKENIKFVDDELVKIKQLIDKEKNEF